MQVPELPPRLTDPRPVFAVGLGLWLVATIVVWVCGSHRALMVCMLGLATGVLGYGIFWLQRRAARRGSKGAQRM